MTGCGFIFAAVVVALPRWSDLARVPTEPLGRDHRAAHARRHAAQDSLGPINWRFQPTQRERTVVLNVLRESLRRRHHPDLTPRVRAPELYRFGQRSQAGRRFLMVAHQPRFRDSGGEHWGISFFVLDANQVSGSLSRPLDMKDAENVRIVRVGDFDRDGSPDVEYCKAYEGEEELPTRHAVTFQSGTWRELPAGTVRPGHCQLDEMIERP